MKIAALIVGVIGGILTAGLGIKWVSDYEANKGAIQSMQKLFGSSSSGEVAAQLHQLDKLHQAGYAMIVLGLLSIVAAALVFKKPKPAGGVLIASSLIPAVLAPSSLIATFLLPIGGALALLAKGK